MNRFLFALLTFILMLGSGCHFTRSVNISDFPEVCGQKIGLKFNERNCTLRKGYLEHEYLVCEECSNIMIWLNGDGIINALMISRMAKGDYEKWKKQLMVYFDFDPDDFSPGENTYMETWKGKKLRCILSSNLKEDKYSLNIYYQ